MGCAKAKVKAAPKTNPKPKPVYILSPDGHHLTEADLPLPGHKHWNGIQKAMVVAAVEGGLISQSEATRRYALSTEEFLTWKLVLQEYGVDGLQASQAQAVRNASRH